MANSLIKDTQIVSQVGVEDVPAVPYRPAVPPRTVYEQRQVCTFRNAGPGHYEFSTDSQTGQTRAIWIPDNIAPGGGNSGGLQSQWICSLENVPVFIPAQPAQAYVPGHSQSTTVLSTGYNLGWNAGARSIGIFKNDGYVQFSVRAAVVGVICGINFYDGINANYNGNTIDFGFYCARGRAWLIRNGQIGASVGTYTDESVFRITRADDEISFLIDGSTVATDTTGVPAEAGWLEASMYSGDDEVFNPSIVEEAADLTTETGEIEASMEAMTVFAAAGEYASIVSSLPRMTASAEAGLATPGFSVGNFILPAMSMEGDSITGEVGQINVAFERLDMLAADHPYGELVASLPSMQAYLTAFEGNTQASLSSMGLMSSTMAPTIFLVVTMNSQGIATSTLAVDVLVSAEMLSQAQAGSTIAANALLDAVMVSVASSGSTLGVPGADSETWVVNLSSRGSTNYTNYSFNSFAQIGSRFFGASSDGIFALEGNTDDGAQIDANISFGELDFDTALKKTIVYCYLGMSGEGHLYMKLVADGREYLYRAESFGDRLRQHRVKFGKGLRENYLTVEVHNVDGNDFEVNSVEFHLADLSRRI